MAIKSSNQITFTEHKKIIEIKEYYLATSMGTGVTTETTGWTTNIQTINYTDKYLWNYEEVIYSIGSSEVSEPVIIGFYGQGANGKGIDNIVNYYQVTQKLIVPDLNSSTWVDAPPLLSSTDKYLWNYEAIVYTDNTVVNTEPALIGVYGDSGADAIVFEIYSVKGFVFRENVTEIELKAAAFIGGETITNATYTWEWWSEEGGGYVTIVKDVQDPTLTVSDGDIYAYAGLRCIMNFDGGTYEDYVSLSNAATVYTAAVKFFDGSNIFEASEEFIVAYVDLYKDQQIEETVVTPYYYYHVDNTYDASANEHSFNSTAMDDRYKYNGSLMYVIYKVINGSSGDTKYTVRLCQYDGTSWQHADNTEYTNKYIYRNDMYTNMHYHTKYNKDLYATNVMVISRADVARCKEINFVIYKKILDDSGNINYENDLIVSRSNVTVIDLNDPIISAIAPENPKDGQLWLNTSASPYTLYVYQGGDWVYFTQQNGKIVHTSKPSSYAEGDLWVLGPGEVCINSEGEKFTEGSMLRATQGSSVYSDGHWEDVMESLTILKTNINQYFSFDAKNGLTIGQSDDAFYVNITSTEMSFIDNSTGQHSKVVYINNQTANIDGLTVETQFEADCPASFNQEVNFFGFMWKKESNGSFSLALAEDQ